MQDKRLLIQKALRILNLKNSKDYLPLEIDFFKRPAIEVAPDLIGCLLLKREKNNQLTWGVIVETEAYSQSEEACHGYKNRTKSNETLFKGPGRLYVYLTYGTYNLVNIVTYKDNWADGVLLRAIAMPDEHERVASGPGLLAKRFNLTKNHDNLLISIENGLWLSKTLSAITMGPIIQTTRIGISKAKKLPWRWYLQNSRSVSKRKKGDRLPHISKAWKPNFEKDL